MKYIVANTQARIQINRVGIAIKKITFNVIKNESIKMN